MKPVLFSAFVLPGSGYFLLKKPIQGIGSMLVILGILVVFVKEALYKSEIISQRIVSGDIDLDISKIREAILNTPGQVDPSTLSLLTYVFIGIWIYSVIDCYRLTKSTKKPNEE